MLKHSDYPDVLWSQDLAHMSREWLWMEHRGRFVMAYREISACWFSVVAISSFRCCFAACMVKGALKKNYDLSDVFHAVSNMNRDL